MASPGTIPWLSVFCCALFCCWPEADTCSSMTHIEIGERIQHFLDINSEGVNYTQLILKHPDAYQAGCPYPDAYYPGLCFDGNFHDVSEETHWTPFMNATINYIRYAYPRPWSEAGEKLVVFLLGVIQHQVADVNWHSLGIDQGFLETMGKVNYHGSFGAAHNDGDFGADVMNLFGLDMDFIPLVGTWYIPVDDLLNIYTDLYGRNDTMYSEVVVECTNWLFLGRLGENLGVIEYLYPDYAAASTFLVDRLQDFFLGGIDDMAAWSGNVFGHAVTMLDHGTEVCNLPRNPIYIQCNVLEDFKSGGGIQYHKSAENPKRLTNVHERYDWLKMAVAMVHPDDYVIQPTDRGVYFKTTEHYEDRLAEFKALKKSKFDEIQRNYTSPDVFYRTSLNYSRLGEALLAGDVNSDGDVDLVLAAPGYSVPGNYQGGRVYVVYGTAAGLPADNITVENEADVILDSPELNGRFGTSLALVDLNADGYNDLAVSAPTVGSDALEYFGQVYVYFGSVSGLSQAPDVIVTCGEIYCNLGWSLSAGDVNKDGYNDLLIGAPFAPSGGEQRGFVGALFSDTSFTGGNFGEGDLSWRYNGEQDYEWLGFSVTSWIPSPGEVNVAVGSPSYRLCDNPDCPEYSEDDRQAVGKVYTFKNPLSDTSDVVLSGNVSFGQLGFTVSGSDETSQPLLGVAATTEDYYSEEESNSSVPVIQLGHVSIYDNNDILSDPFFSVIGDRPFGRMGANIKFLDINGDAQADVILSAPLRSDTVEDDREAGRAYVFLADESMRGKSYTVNEADMTLGLGENKARFGYSVAPIRTKAGEVQLAISAPHSNLGGRLAGLVTVYNL